MIQVTATQAGSFILAPSRGQLDRYRTTLQHAARGDPISRQRRATPRYRQDRSGRASPRTGRDQASLTAPGLVESLMSPGFIGTWCHRDTGCWCLCEPRILPLFCGIATIQHLRDLGSAAVWCLTAGLRPQWLQRRRRLAEVDPDVEDVRSRDGEIASPRTFLNAPVPPATLTLATAPTAGGSGKTPAKTMSPSESVSVCRHSSSTLRGGTLTIVQAATPVPASAPATLKRSRSTTMRSPELRCCRVTAECPIGDARGQVDGGRANRRSGPVVRVCGSDDEHDRPGNNAVASPTGRINF